MAKLTADEAAHAASITDKTVMLVPTPPAFKPKILIASVIRKPPEVIAAFLKTLAWQELRKPAEVSYAFITNFPEGDPVAAPVKALLAAFAKEHKRVKVTHAPAEPADYGDGLATRQWTPAAWHRVGALKNQLLQQALDTQADAIWLVDADVLCDPYTLQSLCDTDAPVVAGVYWTHWSKPQPGDNFVVHAGPQVWLRHPYVLSGRGYTEAEFRAALIERKLVQVWGLGACTLFSRGAIAKGVNFTPLPEGLPPGPMSDGEDRHLCERARRLHLPLHADAWPNIYHAYHASEYAKIPKWLDRLQAPRPERPSAEDLVSFKIEILEPVPHPLQATLLQQVPPHFVRGRLGQLNVLPEIAEALAGMRAGERRLLSLHFPSHYPYATLRLQSRLAALTLFDLKSFNLPPVVGQELFSGGRSWRTIDMTTLTKEQIVSLEEEAASVSA